MPFAKLQALREERQPRFFTESQPPRTADSAARDIFQQIENCDGVTVKIWQHIPEGSFLMGEHENLSVLRKHELKILAAFRLAAVPVTNEQYARFSPAHLGEESHHPVVNVTWHNAMEYCSWLDEQFAWAKGARLPTEEEWEYACRAGTSTRYWIGDTETDLNQGAWYRGNTDRVHGVAEKRPNPWGLYDMHGNVNEWTLSSQIDYSGRRSHEIDPSTVVATSPGSPERVIRGGSYLKSTRAFQAIR